MVGYRHGKPPQKLDLLAIAALALAIANAITTAYLWGLGPEVETFMGDEVVLLENRASGDGRDPALSLEVAHSNLSPAGRGDALVHHDLFLYDGDMLLMCVRARAFAEYRWIDAATLPSKANRELEPPPCEYQECINIRRNDARKNGFYHLAIKPDVIVAGLPAGQTVSFRSLYEINGKACPEYLPPLARGSSFDELLSFVDNRTLELRYLATTAADGRHERRCMVHFSSDEVQAARQLRIRNFPCKPVQ